ncbi:hypothetical protein THAOC_01063 [Thalassiosira oceanica]|uniref:Uncharacterized protein n=1 Tax=Thalassiosira oceanica TaxID=159749 RepID=K0THY9_THAOC|nr:hypothetical protein THAOC_01063 [Thalassiosira oceanica]|eukprot:EJK77125.1 hypothetical protein THAOC_01063 [Thalassiosira oceanica]
MPNASGAAFPKNPPSETLSRRRATRPVPRISAQVDVLLSRNRKPLGSLKGGNMVHSAHIMPHAPCMGEVEGPCALTQCGSHQPTANGLRGEEKENKIVCYVQVNAAAEESYKQPLTLTSSTQFLQALKGRPSIHRTAFLSVRSEYNEDLQLTML